MAMIKGIKAHIRNYQYGNFNVKKKEEDHKRLQNLYIEGNELDENKLNKNQKEVYNSIKEEAEARKDAYIKAHSEINPGDIITLDELLTWEKSQTPAAKEPAAAAAAKAELGFVSGPEGAQERVNKKICTDTGGRWDSQTCTKSQQAEGEGVGDGAVTGEDMGGGGRRRRRRKGKKSRRKGKKSRRKGKKSRRKSKKSRKKRRKSAKKSRRKRR